MLLRNPVVSRLIRFMLSDPNGPIYTQHCWTTLRFRGRSVFHLRNEVARHTRFVLEGRQPFDLVMCVQAGRHGRLTPLFVDLPRGSRGHQLSAVVRVVLAFNAVSFLDATAATTILTGGVALNATLPLVSGMLKIGNEIVSLGCVRGGARRRRPGEGGAAPSSSPGCGSMERGRGWRA